MKKKHIKKSQRRIGRSSRDYNDPQFKEFRQAVRKRDRYRCQWPGCGAKRRLNVHHIKTWAQHKLLRYVVKNGILLCHDHHKKVTGNEELYEKMFNQILRVKAQKTMKEHSDTIARKNMNGKYPKCWSCKKHITGNVYKQGIHGIPSHRRCLVKSKEL